MNIMLHIHIKEIIKNVENVIYGLILIEILIIVMIVNAVLKVMIIIVLGLLNVLEEGIYICFILC